MRCGKKTRTKNKNISAVVDGAGHDMEVLDLVPTKVFRRSTLARLKITDGVGRKIAGQGGTDLTEGTIQR